MEQTKQTEVINILFRLKEYRKNKKWTLHRMAQELHTTWVSIFNWEHGKFPDSKNLMCIINFFKTIDSPPPTSLPTDKLAAVQSPTPTESPPEIVLPVEVSQTIAKG